MTARPRVSVAALADATIRQIAFSGREHVIASERTVMAGRRAYDAIAAEPVQPDQVLRGEHSSLSSAVLAYTINIDRILSGRSS